MLGYEKILLLSRAKFRGDYRKSTFYSNDSGISNVANELFNQSLGMLVIDWKGKLFTPLWNALVQSTYCVYTGFQLCLLLQLKGCPGNISQQCIDFISTITFGKQIF